MLSSICNPREVLLTPGEAAKVLNISRDGVRRLVANGALGARRIGHLIRIRESDLRDYIDAAKIKSN